MPAIPHQESRLDEHGQRMPFTHAEFNTALRSGVDFHNNNINATRNVEIQGQHYIVKSVDTVGQDFHTSHYDQQRNEAATVAAMKALGYEHLAPSEAYHVVSAEGRRMSVIKVEAGDTVSNFNRSDVAHGAKLDDLQKAYVGSYLTGMRDRHPGNMLYDKTTGGIRHIDFGFGLKGHAQAETRDIARDIWQEKVGAGKHLELNRDIVRSALQREKSLRTSLNRFNVTAAERQAIRERFNALRDLYRSGSPITTDALEAKVGKASVFVT